MTPKLLLKSFYAIVLILASVSCAEVRQQNFDSDPNWEGLNNRIKKDAPTVTQDFGYRGDTHFAGKAAGEMGGQVTRASDPAFYADDIGQKTLDEKLSASG